MIQGFRNKAAGRFAPVFGRTRGLPVLAPIALALGLSACQVPAATLDQAKEAAASASVAPAPAVPGAMSASSLIGLPQERIAEFFGKPGQVRRESPAEVWQYSNASCVVDIYLYQVTGGGLSVSFIEARDKAALETAPELCFEALAQRAAL